MKQTCLIIVAALFLASCGNSSNDSANSANANRPSTDTAALPVPGADTVSNMSGGTTSNSGGTSTDSSVNGTNSTNSMNHTGSMNNGSMNSVSSPAKVSASNNSAKGSKPQTNTGNH